MAWQSWDRAEEKANFGGTAGVSVVVRLGDVLEDSVVKIEGQSQILRLILELYLIR